MWLVLNVLLLSLFSCCFLCVCERVREVACAFMCLLFMPLRPSCQFALVRSVTLVTQWCALQLQTPESHLSLPTHYVSFCSILFHSIPFYSIPHCRLSPPVHFISFISIIRSFSSVWDYLTKFSELHFITLEGQCFGFRNPFAWRLFYDLWSLKAFKSTFPTGQTVENGSASVVTAVHCGLCSAFIIIARAVQTPSSNKQTNKEKNT